MVNLKGNLFLKRISQHVNITEIVVILDVVVAYAGYHSWLF